MTPIAQQTMRVLRTFDMKSLRHRASMAQHWRRRLAAERPLAWVEFVRMFGDEIKDERAALARQIKGMRHRGGLR